ncbi:hypothetical protein [Mesoterricola silvestris]|nr:hypothetical protein [Mesoterricola silvestris]
MQLIQMSFNRHLEKMAGELPHPYVLTLLARNTERKDADILMTRDILPEIIQAVSYLEKQEGMTQAASDVLSAS